MGLKRFFATIREPDHPKCQKCTSFEVKADRLMLIPPPKRIRIVVISHDPPLYYRPIYKYATERMSGDKSQARALLMAGIPGNLCSKIYNFLLENGPKPGVSNADLEVNKIMPSLLENTYWTHLHKCATDKSYPFDTVCAREWLKDEIESAKSAGTRAIVAVGKPVADWLDKNGIKTKTGLEIAKLPHPSGANNARWYTEDEDKKKTIREEIEKLVNALSDSTLSPVN
jgi:hypothetical protein